MIDNIDLQIINILYNKSIRTWGLMKTIYPRGKDSEHMIIIRKIKKLIKYGIITEVENGKNSYVLIKDYVRYGEFRFPDNFKDKKSIFLFINGRWMCFSLN